MQQLQIPHFLDIQLATLASVAPLEVDLLGPDTVREIVEGSTFESAAGGRDIDLSDIISIVQGIATFAQAVLLAIVWYKEHREKLPSAAVSSFEQMLSQIRQYLMTNSAASRFFQKEPAKAELVLLTVLREYDNRTKPK
jgi:diphthamide synthase (EF-2-diphthine--ammonia ligase)